jgi:PEP-CTERM motif
MKLKKLASAIALGLGLGVMVAPAYAGNLHFFEDDDLEWVLRPTTNGGVTTYNQITAGNLVKGDVLYSVFEIPTYEINGVNAIPTGKELTGVTAIEVDTDLTTGSAYTFKPWASFETQVGYTGAMVAMWMNDLSNDVDLIGDVTSELSCSALDVCTTQVTAGDLYQVDGFLGDVDEFWRANAFTSDLAVIKAGAADDPFVVFRAGLSNIFHAPGPIGYVNPANGRECVDSTGCVQFTVSGVVYGGNGFEDTNIIGRSDFQARKYDIPEPTSIALVGLALLGLGATARRRNKV